uniref:Small ribosomal subunit protein uS15 N-terminal domain-containing protein n=1 Tax=Sus scrofa TaxID=9823 RepID=A0A8D1DIL0_PIG
MGHMPAPGRACLSLLCPPAHSVPTCLKLTSDNVQEQIYKLAKKDLTPSQIVCDLHPSFWQCWILNTLSEVRD